MAMKTLIVYASKHGAAAEIGHRIGKKLGAKAYDLKSGKVPPLDGYDCVIVGSSVYAGKLRKEAKAFVSENADALNRIKLGLYVSGMAQEGEEGYLTGNYPQEIVARAAAKAMLGGIADPKKENLFEKLVMRIVTKSGQYKNTISDEKINAFVGKLKG